MGRKKGSIPWNKGIKYTSKMKENLDLSGLSIGRQKGIKKPGLSINNPMFKKENIEKVKNNPSVQAHQFKKGHIPWTKGKKGIHLSPDTEYKKGNITWNTGKKVPEITGKNHPNWHGDNVGYHALHSWIQRTLGKASKCSVVGEIHGKRFEWANISGKYKRDVNDWVEMCSKHHHQFDHIAEKGWKTKKNIQS